MRLKKVQAVSTDRAVLTVKVDLPTGEASMILSYICPDCSGWGCGNPRRNMDCKGGRVTQKLDPAKLDEVFEDDDLESVEMSIQHLCDQMMSNCDQNKLPGDEE